MEYRRIRRYRLFLRTGRWIRKHCGLLFLLLAKVSKMWRRLQNRNKLIKKLDWYLIRKFIGTYIYSILLKDKSIIFLLTIHIMPIVLTISYETHWRNWHIKLNRQKPCIPRMLNIVIKQTFFIFFINYLYLVEKKLLI